MTSLKRWLETIDYQITEGSEHQWQCYGHDAYYLDHFNHDGGNCALHIIFDRKDQTVYEMQAHDYANNRSYRWIDPEFVQAHKAEALQKNVDADQAWDDVKYIDLDVDEDFFEKARAIFLGQDYDTRVQVPIEFTDEELLKYMTLAHERDMTFNQLIEEALRQAVEDFKRDPEAFKQRAKEWSNR